MSNRFEGMRMARKEKIKKSYVLWNTFGSVFYSMCQWAITILVVYVATYEAAGYLSIAMTMSSSFSAISLFSMRNYQISDTVGEFSSSQYISSRIWTCLISIIACITVAVFSNSFYQAVCVVAFMLIRVAEAVADVMHGIDQKYNRYDYIGISYVIRGIMTVTGFTVILYCSGDLAITLLTVAGLNFMSVLLYDCKMTYGLDHYRIMLTDSKIWQLLAVCVPLVIFTFLLSLENLIPKNVLQYFEGTESLGIYSTIASPTLIVQVLASVAFSPFLPQLAKIYNEGDIDVFRSGLRKVYLYLLLITVLVLAGAVIMGRWGLAVLFGADILQYYFLFMPIVLCTLFTGFCWIICSIVILMRKIKQLIIAIFFDFSICAVIVFPVVECAGQNGVSIVQLITLPILLIMMIGICEWSCKKTGGYTAT